MMKKKKMGKIALISKAIELSTLVNTLIQKFLEVGLEAVPHHEEAGRASPLCAESAPLVVDLVEPCPVPP
eukprot:CAMPEP_0114343576 /NCGR_PEP_ID=MMETSP0101-20121206/10716_1 /TAXON_ID=38822 ORGANISM="Pteridomonas danica, Strain PT" /NCGR_SAMPLE_ID=MMETSP0101 /ASSEMBLY_ACC=CAM_ASM_000211 /LENGTH=69 /DNA_ID=CAMNT_0001478379 /DNA_START=67 /DNA_END=276 /DNA_ORIENTATION=+